MQKSIFSVLLLAILAVGCTNEKTLVTVRFSEIDFLQEMSVNTSDSIFILAFDYARKKGIDEKTDLVNLFCGKLLELNPNASLANYFATVELKDKINFNSPNQKVIDVLKTEFSEGQKKAIDVIKKRIETAFISEGFFGKFFNKPKVSIVELQANTYSFTINRKADKDFLVQLIEQQNDFGFWETYFVSEIWEYFDKANQILKNLVPQQNSDNKTDATEKAEMNLLGIKQNDSLDFVKENPLFSVLRPSVSNDGQFMQTAEVGVVNIKDTALINSYLSNPEISILFPRNLKLLWSATPYTQNSEFIGLIAVKISTLDGKAPLGAEYIVEASVDKSSYMPGIMINMNAEGARIWAIMTRDNISRQIAIVNNNKVYSFPMVQSEIEGGNSQISGNFTDAEAHILASLLNAGMMPSMKAKVLDVK